MEDPLVTKMASEHQKTPAQILLRYLLQRDIAIIPKSVNEKRIKENFDVSFIIFRFLNAVWLKDFLFDKNYSSLLGPILQHVRFLTSNCRMMR